MTLSSKTLVIASHNEGKVREIAALLEPRGVEVTSAGALGLAVPEETETTFVGNARIKAHAAAKASGMQALSDDSGLEVAALDGAPGVYTADWAETPNGRDFYMAMEKVWAKVQCAGATPPFHARFVCVLCLAWPDGTDEVFEGSVEGEVVWPPRGSKGFGFDPVFVPTGHEDTFGEMDPDRKHGMSHRADAFGKLVRSCFD